MERIKATLKKIATNLKTNKQVKKITKIITKIDLSKNKFNTIELGLIFVMALVFGILIGEMTFSTGKTSLSLAEKNEAGMEEIENVYNTIVEEYIDKIEESKLKEAAIDGMMKVLGDQHSIYYNEEESSNFTDELNGYFYGMGAGVSQEKGKLVTIIEIYPNSPAEKAGLREGDQYLKINGEDVTKLTSDEISEKIKGENNKEFNLTVKREDEEVTLKVVTGKVEIPSVTSKIINRNNKRIGYLEISIFASNTDEQLKRKLQEFEKENIDKLIIDLRYNQGGHLDTVINIASEFLPEKTPILKIVTKKSTQTQYSKGNKNKKYDIVVLINAGSASASEVLAAALNEQLNAELIGKTTFGKGTVQKTKNLPSGGLMKYTVETWQTSKGKSIDKKGVEPTIEITQNKKYFDTYRDKDDAQLQKAIQVILK